jgi:mannosyltransferase OCH1-like enzyme
MDTWKEKNPSCHYMLWTEPVLKSFEFRNQKQIDTMQDLNGKCDIMRFEILHKYGGILVDADSECLNTLDDFFFEETRWACYENELVGIDPDGTVLVSESIMACEPVDSFFYYCIHELGMVDMQGKEGFQATGNRFFTDMIAKRANLPMKIYPSHYFIPQHATQMIRKQASYSGSDKVYAKHYWGSTFQIYGTKEMI